MSKRENLMLAMNAGLKAGRAIMEIYAGNTYNTVLKADRSPLTEADRQSHKIISQALKPTGIPVLSEEGSAVPWSRRKNWKCFWLVDPLDGTREFIRRNGDFTVNIALISGARPLLGVVYAPDNELMYAAVDSLGAWKVAPCTKQNITSWQAFLNASENLPLPDRRKGLAIVASRTHQNQETRQFIKSMKKNHPGLKVVSRGSALKFALVAEGSADIYPRLGPTWEWDTGAGQAIAEAAGCSVRVYKEGRPLTYNKQELTNPWFIVERE